MSRGEAAAADGSPKYEFQALNFHSSICNTGAVMDTFIVPDNIYIVSLGTFGGWTKDSLSENLGNKIVTGQDLREDGTPNRDLANWLKKNYSKLIPDPEYGDLLLYYPKILCPDRILTPDRDAMDPRNHEFLSMRYFTEDNPKGETYGLVDFLTRRRVEAPEPRKAALKVAEKAKGSYLFLSDFIKKISKQNSGKKIILFLLGCQVIPKEIEPKQVILTENYLKAKKAGLILIEMLPRISREDYSDVEDVGPVHKDTFKEGALTDAGWLDVNTISSATRNMREKMRGPLSADFNIDEIKRIAEKIIDISNKQESPVAKRMKPDPFAGGKRKRRKMRKKTRRQIGCGTKKKNTRKRKIKRTRKNKSIKKRITKRKR